MFDQWEVLPFVLLLHINIVSDAYLLSCYRYMCVIDVFHEIYINENASARSIINN